MKVIRGFSTNKNQNLMSPFPDKGFFFFELRGGDYLQPNGKGDWFHPPYFPDGVTRKYFGKAVCPFISWQIPLLNWKGYFGAKAYGVDSDAYKEGICKDFPEEVYSGSQAFMTSARFFAKIN